MVQRYGMVWHGMYACMLLYGMVWHGMACHGMAWYGMVWYVRKYACTYVHVCMSACGLADG